MMSPGLSGVFVGDELACHLADEERHHQFGNKRTQAEARLGRWRVEVAGQSAKQPEKTEL